jgi:signal recognition particle receptor subunit beta
MVQFRPQSREIIAKVVYYGPALGGKTTNLRTLFQGYPPSTRGELVVVPTGGDRTIFFDFLPIYAGELRGMQLRVQLYTVPGQVHYNATRQVVLRGVDGVVFVADSQREMMSANRDSFENLKENLLLQGLTLGETPHVLQYNKRDLRNPVPVEELDQFLNEFNAPFFEAVATQGIGVEETLQGIIKLVARSLRDRFKVAVPSGEARAPVAVIASSPAPPAAPSPAVAPGLRKPAGGFDGPTIVSPLPRPPAEPLRTPARMETSPFSVPPAPAPAPAAAPVAASARPAPPWASRELTQPQAVEEIEYEEPTGGVPSTAAPVPEPSPYLRTPPPPAPTPVATVPAAAPPVSAGPPVMSRPPVAPRVTSTPFTVAPATSAPSTVPATAAPVPPARVAAAPVATASAAALRTPPVFPPAATVTAPAPPARPAAPSPAPTVPPPEDPFDVTMPLPSRSIPAPRRIDDVFALAPPVQPAPVIREQAAQAAALAVQRVVPRAIAQYGEVRELELEVPVPSAWVGGTRMTLQLRLTLVPQEEKDSG